MIVVASVTHDQFKCQKLTYHILILVICENVEGKGFYLLNIFRYDVNFILFNFYFKQLAALLDGTPKNSSSYCILNFWAARVIWCILWKFKKSPRLLDLSSLVTVKITFTNFGDESWAAFDGQRCRQEYYRLKWRNSNEELIRTCVNFLSLNECNIHLGFAN